MIISGSIIGSTRRSKATTPEWATNYFNAERRPRKKMKPRLGLQQHTSDDDSDAQNVRQNTGFILRPTFLRPKTVVVDNLDTT